VAEVVNGDPRSREHLRLIYLPDYRVTLAEAIIPAAELSEQISTAGTEASGTSNMKFALNGAVTIGTLDGANIEIREEVGADNFFSFGLTTAEIARLRAAGYQPRAYFHANDELRAVIEVLRSGFFSRGDTELFQPLLDSLLDCDPYLVMADHQAYVDAQDRVDRAWRDPDAWTRMSIVNSASSGRFSSDRTVREYCEDIWRINPVRIRLLSQQDVKAGLTQ